MKRLIYLSMLCFIALSSGCSYNELPEDLDINLPIDNRISLNVETRAEVYNGIELDREYFVTASDLEKFVEFRCNTSKRSNFSVKEVKSYGFDSSQTLFYILNYNEGWEVVAADKRIQPTLAHGDSGAFTMDCDNEPMKFWMNMLAEGVLQTRRNHAEPQSTTTTADTATTNSTNSDTPAVSSSEEQYVDFWNAINLEKSNTKGPIPPITFNPNPTTPGYGETYQYTVDSETTVIETKYGNLLTTTWGQDSPWNAYCPLKTDGSTEKTPVGCTAVAGAQLLYYFATSLGWSIAVPTRCYSAGNLDIFYRRFDDYSLYAWENMATEYSLSTDSINKTAILEAFVGEICDMEYGNTGSSASPSDLMEAFENFFNISSTMGGLWCFDEEIVIESISNSLPVFIWGADTIFGGGHSWLIDGYTKKTNQRTTYYITSDTPLSADYLATLDKDDADFSTSYSYTTKTFHMNWGWSGTYDGEFSLLPDEWTITDNNGNEVATYDVVMRMIYNFSKNQ